MQRRWREYADVAQRAAPSAAGAPASTALADGQALPLKGSFSIATQASFNCPPTCPPTIMSVTGTQEGTATHLGRFTAVQTDRVDLATSTATGTYNFTAADGDELFATTVSLGEPTVPPNIANINGTGTIVGGTGRFAGATGSFSYRLTDGHRFCERHVHRIRLVRGQPGFEPVNQHLHTATRTGRRPSRPVRRTAAVVEIGRAAAWHTAEARPARSGPPAPQMPQRPDDRSETRAAFPVSAAGPQTFQAEQLVADRRTRSRA